MLAYLLSILFPPRPGKLGKIVGVDTVVLLHAIEQGSVRVYGAESETMGAGRVFEWPYGREGGYRRRVR
jgi:hypothetical protein